MKNLGKFDQVLCKSKGLSDENIKPPSTSDNSLSPGSYIDNTK